MRTTKYLLIFAFALLVSMSSWAQSGNARINGTVTDATGAKLPGAEVTMTNAGTGITRTATTGSDGTFSIPELPAGPYSFSVKKEGFQGYKQDGIILEVGTDPSLNAALQVGSVSQQITVSSNAAIVETHNSSLGQVVSQQEVLDIPLNARDPMQLLTLTPAAVNVPGAVNNTSMNFPNPYQISFAGSNPGEGTYILDGGNDNDEQTNDSFPMPFPDAVQEFNVVTSAVPAQYGLHGSASVNAIVKSGTNSFHGDAFEFLRNYHFNAKSYYAPTKDTLTRHQFGGVIGGPIHKNKIFFFAAFQDTLVNDLGASSVILPTTAQLHGDFTQCAATTGYKSVLASPLNPTPGHLDPATFSAPSVNLAKLLPTPQDPLCGVYNYTTVVSTTSPTTLGKVDWHINDKHSAFIRYYYNRYFLPPDLTNIITQSQHDQRDTYQSATFGETWIVNNSIVNVFHANTNHAYDIKGFGPQVPTAESLGVGGNYHSPVANYMSATITGDFGIKGGGLNPVYFNPTDFQFGDDFDFTHKSHQMAFGVNYIHFNMSQQSTIDADGNFTFNGGTTGLAISDFLLGNVSLFNKSNIIWNHPPKQYIGLYAQDAWQATSRLTINYGVRWEPYIPYYSSDGEGMFYNYANAANGVHSSLYPTAPAGVQYSGTGNSKGDFPGRGNSYLGTYALFEPRVGLSFDPRGNGREVIRASYGTFYDFEPGQYNLPIVSSPPWADVITLTGVNWTNPFGACPANTGLSCGPFTYAGKTGVDPFPILPSANFVFPNGGSYASYDSLHPQESMLQQWNLSIQKQIGSNYSLTFTYLGNHNTHLIINSEGNPGTWYPGSSDGTSNTACGNTIPTPVGGTPTKPVPCSSASNTQARRYLSQNNLLGQGQGGLISTIARFQTSGTETYHGGVVSFQKRMSHNFSITTNYTYSHCIDTGEPSGTFTGAVYRGPSDAREVGNCTWDHRHVLTINAVLRSPQYKNRVVNAIIGHWQASPIAQHISGDWLTVTTGVDTALTGDATNQWASRAPGVAISVPHTRIGTAYGLNFFNPKAFVAPTAPAGFAGNLVDLGFGPVNIGPIGNLGRNTLNGPSNTNFDLALTREFHIHGENRVEARVEAFNVFNLTRITDPTTALNSPLAGQSVAPLAIGNVNTIPGYSTPQDPRIMQFAVKYMF